MNTNRKNSTDEQLKALFRAMPLETPSLHFTENLLARIEKETRKEKRKQQLITALQWAASVASVFCVPGLALYLCRTFIPDFSFSFTMIHIDPLIPLSGFSILLLLLADSWLRKHIRDK
jgi:hypothetical protein